MDSLLPAILVAAVVLACPLGMAGMGIAVWLIARARGQKKDLSVGCMPGHGEQPSEQPKNAELEEQIARLQGEVDSLRTQATTGRSES